MAYSKQTWTDDVSAVTGARMTHIEQGIYDNSLATDKINPSGTATTSAEIEAGQISDVIGFKSLKLKGQTNQYTTTGKNKFNVNGTITTRNNATAVITNDVLKQTNTGTYSRTEWLITGLTANTDYTLKCKYSNPSGASIQLRLLKSDNSTTIANSSISTSTSGTLEATGTTTETSCYIRIYSNTLNESNNKVVEFSEIQLESGSSATSYEKYTGEKASPNPDFPQEVNNVSGDNVIIINSKNIANPNDIFAGYPAGSIGDTITFTASVNTTTYKKACYIEANQQYTLSWKINTPKSIGGREIKITDENGKLLYNISYSNANNVRTKNFTSPYSGYAYIALDANATELQVEKGSSATSYIAHQGNNFEIDLPVENLFFLPDATITNGIEYTINNDGTFNVYGTASANTTISLTKDLELTKIKETTYTFSVNQTLPVGVEIRIEGFNGNTWKRHLGGSPLNSSNSIKNGTADLTDVNKIRTAIYVHSGISVNMKNVAVQFEKGSTINSFTPYGVTPIYLGEIGTDCNDIRKYNGKWYWHKEVGKVILDGVNYKAGTKSGTTANIMYTTGNIPNLKPVSNNGVLGNLITSHFKNTTTDIIYSGDVIGIGQRTNEQISIGLGLSSTLTTLELFNTWLTNNNVDVYYPLATPIDEEITYAPLLRQLDEVYNSGLYDVTNISQDNSSEAFILDLEACKNNINGIVEYIRR